MTQAFKKHPEPELFPRKISRVSNSNQNFFDVVLLLQEENKQGYRLIIHHNGQIKLESIFATVRGARIAYTKYCQCRSRKKEVKTEWTPPYYPEKDWLEKILTSSKTIMSDDENAKNLLGAF